MLHGQTALDMAALDPPDIIVIDLMMPGLGADAVLHRLRAEWHTRSIPVMILSAIARAEFYRELAEEVDGWLTKPVSPTQLGRHLDRIAKDAGIVMVRRESADASRR